MKKIAFILLAFLFIACSSTRVTETETYSKAQSNVLPSQPIESNVTPAPQPQPTPAPQPNPAPYPGSVEPVAPTPMDPEPITPVQPVQPAPVQPTPVQPAGDPEWAGQIIQAVGNCAASTTGGQAKLMAKRGSQMDAQRQLMEQVLGIRLDSKTYVRDMVTQSDEIKGSMEGIVKGAYVINENFDGSVYTTTMGLRLVDVYNYMKSNKVYYK